MKVLRALIVVLITIAIEFLSVSCTSSGSTATVAPQTATVKRGNIIISVTGTGNLALEIKQELSFGQTGIASQTTTAKISMVNVVPGQLVTKGQVLVTADPTDWQNQLITDQHNLDTATAGVAQAQANVAQAQANIAQTQGSIAQAQANIHQVQMNLIQDNISLTNAQQTLAAQQDVQLLQTEIDNANIQLQQVRVNLKQAANETTTNNVAYWNSQITYFTVDTNPNPGDPHHQPDGGLIGVLQKRMSELIKDPAHAGATLVNGATSVTQIQQFSLAVQQAQAKIDTDQANLATAQASLATAQANLITSQANLPIAQNNVLLAQNKVDDAKLTLANDKNSAQEIDAPFDGLITQVNVVQGQIAQRNATLVEIADPKVFEAIILVTERDVMSVKIGDNATVSFSALQGLIFPAKIIRIAPLASIQQGVVNYQLTAELTSLIPVTPARAVQASPGGASGTPPATRSPGATATGTPASGAAPPNAARPSAPGGAPAGIGTAPFTGRLQSINLKDGLSATVTIPIQEKDNVLILPSRAITRQGQNSTVQLMSGATTVATNIVTGITDGINTEIVSGVNEGDQISLQTKTAATPVNNPPPPGGGGLRIP